MLTPLLINTFHEFLYRFFLLFPLGFGPDHNRSLHFVHKIECDYLWRIKFCVGCAWYTYELFRMITYHKDFVHRYIIGYRIWKYSLDTNAIYITYSSNGVLPFRTLPEILFSLSTFTRTLPSQLIGVGVELGVHGRALATYQTLLVATCFT
jgi:hypothetical protein